MFQVNQIPFQPQQEAFTDQVGSSKKIKETESAQPVTPVSQDVITTDNLDSSTEEETSTEKITRLESNQTEELEKHLEKLKESTTIYGHSISFELYKESEELMVRIIHPSGKVIRSIPPEEFLSMSEKLEWMRGNLLDALA